MQPASTAIATMSVPFTRIPNWALELFLSPETAPKTNLGHRIVGLVWRQTYGFNRTFVDLSTGELVKSLRSSKRSVMRHLAQLKNNGSPFFSVRRLAHGLYRYALKDQSPTHGTMALIQGGAALNESATDDTLTHLEGEEALNESATDDTLIRLQSESATGESATGDTLKCHRWHNKVPSVALSNVINIGEYGVERSPKERQRKKKEKEVSKQALVTDDLCGAQTPEGASQPEPEGFEGDEGSKDEAPREAVAPKGSARRQLFERLWRRYDEAPEGCESTSRLGALRWDAATRGDKDKRRLSDFDDRTLIKALGALMAKHNGQRPVKDSSVMLLLLARDIEDGEKSHLPDFTLKHLDFIRQGTPIEELLTDGTSTYRLPDDEEAVAEIFQRLLTDGEPAAQVERPVQTTPAEPQPTPEATQPTPEATQPTPEATQPPAEATPAKTAPADLDARKQAVQSHLIRLTGNPWLKVWARARFSALYGLCAQTEADKVKALINNVVDLQGLFERLCLAYQVAEHQEWARAQWTSISAMELGAEQDAQLAMIHAQLDERGVEVLA